jgi:hypothetical protein
VKKLLLPILFVLISVSLHAQTRPDMDTMSLFRLAPGMSATVIPKVVSAQLQTLFDDGAGTGIVKYDASYEDIKGEVRIATQKNIISQVIFVATVPDTSHTKAMFNRFRETLTARYGDPDVDYYNVFREIRWDGMKRSLAVKAQDGRQHISLVLQQFEPKKR